MKLLKADNAMVAIKDLNNFRLMGSKMLRRLNR